MKITVFGATGRTGLHLVDQALARGHAVTVFVRSPAKLGGDALTSDRDAGRSSESGAGGSGDSRRQGSGECAGTHQ